MKTLKFFLVTLAAFVAIENCKAAKPREQMLTVHAEVTSADGDPNGSYALLFIGDQLMDSTGTSAEGGFTLDLPLNVEAVLEVHKPGSVAKRIIVDTHNIVRSKSITCEIMLFPQPPGERMSYATPVGRFSFSPENGELRVEHDYRLVSEATGPGKDALVASGR